MGRHVTDDREKVFLRLKASLDRLPARTPYPNFPADVATPTNRRHGGLSAFRQRLAETSTRVFEDIPSLGGWLMENNALSGYCDPSLAAILRAAMPPAIRLSTTFDRRRPDDYRFGITRASAGIVETGSLVLKDRDTSDRLGAVAPWIHVACLDPGNLYATLAEALTDLDDDPGIILVSGHSQTADVEGIMIHGVHGPGEQACLFLEAEKKTENGP
jgi:L-lactate dehydrogenase complex protein LldG